MSRSSRLFVLIDALRGYRRPVTAAKLADTLNVSVRTIYRDIQTLIEFGAPIEGEAGIGYLLRAGFFLPPLMFDEDELEALVLGARWVQQQGDASLAQAAASVLAKIATASPKDLRDQMANTSLWAPNWTEAIAGDSVQLIRESIRHERKLLITYNDESGSATERTIWPIALAFIDEKRLLSAWCELREGFRHFRVDRISALTALEICYPIRRPELVKAWRDEQNIPENKQ